MSQTASIAANLPYLRRFARALTGSQASGDAYAVATLEAIAGDDGPLKRIARYAGNFIPGIPENLGLGASESPQ